jgi:hypothetical protein
MGRTPRPRHLALAAIRARCRANLVPRGAVPPVSCWQGSYPNSAMACDGVGWSAEIVYSDRSLLSSGDNCFPGWDGRALPMTAAGPSRDDTFAKFCRAVAHLIGREFH